MFILIIKRHNHFSQSKLLQADWSPTFAQLILQEKKREIKEKIKKTKAKSTIYYIPKTVSILQPEGAPKPSEAAIGLHPRPRSGLPKNPSSPQLSTSREPQRWKLESPTQIVRHLDSINLVGAAVTWMAIGRSEAVATDAATSLEFVGDQDTWRRRGRHFYWCVSVCRYVHEDVSVCVHISACL